jgi:hypothetical protein
MSGILFRREFQSRIRSKIWADLVSDEIGRGDALAAAIRSEAGPPCLRHWTPSDCWIGGGIPKFGWNNRRKKPGASALRGLTDTWGSAADPVTW